MSDPTSTEGQGSCSVCHGSFPADQLQHIGKRSFCATHHARAQAASRARLSRSGLVEMVLTLAFVYGASLVLGGEGEAVRTSGGTALLLVVVPAALWLTYIYRQDRVEPEPPGMVLGVFVLGGLLGWAVVLPLAESTFDISQWRYDTPGASWVAALAVLGLLAQLAAYAAVRFTVYLTDEFDEPLDGVVYATAACLGVGTATSLSFVLESDGVLPLAGAALIASTALVHVAAAMPLGLGLSRKRFAGAGGLTTAGWFGCSVLVNGGLTEFVVLTGSRDGAFHPWHLLGTAAGLCLVVLVIGTFLTASLRRQALEDALPSSSTNSTLLSLRGARVEFPLWILAGAGLLGACSFAHGDAPQATTVSALDGKVTVHLPAGWVGSESEGRFSAQVPSLEAGASRSGAFSSNPTVPDRSTALLEIVRLSPPKAPKRPPMGGKCRKGCRELASP